MYTKRDPAIERNLNYSSDNKTGSIFWCLMAVFQLWVMLHSRWGKVRWDISRVQRRTNSSLLQNSAIETRIELKSCRWLPIHLDVFDTTNMFFRYFLLDRRDLSEKCQLFASDYHMLSASVKRKSMKFQLIWSENSVFLWDPTHNCEKSISAIPLRDLVGQPFKLALPSSPFIGIWPSQNCTFSQ
jgi:hypothetical protein